MNNLPQSFVDALPPIIARTHLPKLLGGAVAYQTLCNYAAIGKGPASFKMGKKVCYHKSDVIAWLESRMCAANENTTDSLIDAQGMA